MRLLFDEQLSEQLCEKLNDIFPGSLHVRQLGAGGASDMVVWELARDRGCILVTKDEDFHRLSVLRGVHDVLYTNARPRVSGIHTHTIAAPTNATPSEGGRER